MEQSIKCSDAPFAFYTRETKSLCLTTRLRRLLGNARKAKSLPKTYIDCS